MTRIHTITILDNGVTDRACIHKQSHRACIHKQSYCYNIEFETWLGSKIRDPEKNHPGSGSLILWVKMHRILDPDPQHWAPQHTGV
jgi:hypothetical protein